MRQIIVLIALSVPLAAFGDDHGLRWGPPTRVDPGASHGLSWGVVSEDRIGRLPVVYIYTRPGCVICEEVKSAYAADDDPEFTLKSLPAEPWMESVPWFIMETPESSTGWYRWRGVHRQRGETAYEYVIRRWRQEGGDDWREGEAVSTAEIKGEEAPPPIYSGYPLRPQRWDWGSLGWDPSRRSMIDHLSRPPHNFNREYLETLTERELESLHDDDHEGRTRSPATDHKRSTAYRRSRTYCPT